MSRYTLSPSAKIDISEIRQYTTERWGDKQTAKYTEQLRERLKWLSDNPQFGKKRSEIEEGLYTYPQGSHFIVYRESDEGIEIARVLHKSMDYEYHLTQEQPLQPNQITEEFELSHTKLETGFDEPEPKL